MDSKIQQLELLMLRIESQLWQLTEQRNAALNQLFVLRALKQETPAPEQPKE